MRERGPHHTQAIYHLLAGPRQNGNVLHRLPVRGAAAIPSTFPGKWDEIESEHVPAAELKWVDRRRLGNSQTGSLTSHLSSRQPFHHDTDM
jgi:hypothetical protein